MAEMRQATQCVGIPTYTGRIMGIGENEHAAFGVAYLGKLVEVHRVRGTASLPLGGGCFNERVIYYLAMIALWGEAEGVIYRGLDDDFLVFLHKDIDSHAYALHYTGDICHPLLARTPLVMLLNPLCDMLPIVFRHHGISEEGMIETFS